MQIKRTITWHLHLRGPRRKEEVKILCPRCWEYGYLGKGWVYRDRNRDIYRHRHGIRYRIYYVRHYSPDKYRKQMEKYRSHKIRSRPNGQYRCNIRCRVKLFSIGEYHVQFCRYRQPTYRIYPRIYLGEGKVLYNVKKRVDEKSLDETLPKIYR